MERRTFLKSSAAAALALGLPVSLPGTSSAAPSELRTLMQGLLTDWCNALLRLQIDDPSHPDRHGAFRCPADDFIHGRCIDAVYPLLALASSTGDLRYRDAAVRLFDWAKVVDAPDGAWTNELDPKSWKGTTVFAAIAVAESLQQHGTLLDATVAARWRARLAYAAEFIHQQIDLQYGNINYGLTATYALALLGRVLNEPKYATRARELARQTTKFITAPNRLLFGEGRPMERRSAKGCPPIDLGYNVEESLPAIIQYALLENDEALLQQWSKSALTHLELMLPDGGWDNSWGTRSFKWTYWGSRTSDGCQPLLLLAHRHPALAAAAFRNAQLLRSCTHDGLLHGGPHFASHGVAPCVHHTFAHAKALATALELGVALDRLDVTAPLPREVARGVRVFSEIDTTLAARGPWRATVTGYDWLYPPGIFHATGGALSLLWHRDFGLLFAASLAKFERPEIKNAQPQPDGEDIALTPRVERRTGDAWFTNIHALDAVIRHETSAERIQFTVQTRLANADQSDPAEGPVRFELGYRFTERDVRITARPASGVRGPWSLVLPLVSARKEVVTRISDRRFEIAKSAGVVVIESSAPIRILESQRDRIFNQVPGVEAIPFVVDATDDVAVEAVIRGKA